MDKKQLIELLRDGMKYPPGKHQVWISRCFEIHVRPHQVVELDEYESVDTGPAKKMNRADPRKSKARSEMFHVGRSILRLKEGVVTEHPGQGWGAGEKPTKKT